MDVTTTHHHAGLPGWLFQYNSYFILFFSSPKIGKIRHLIFKKKLTLFNRISLIKNDQQRKRKRNPMNF